MIKNRVILAGTNSGVGKTTISSGIMRLLRNKGYDVQPFKVGPDYIDPGYHHIATGRKSRNLDTWMLGEDLVREIILRQNADIGFIEGVMGLFDGKKGGGITGSTADIARITGTPVILVMDVSSMAGSAAAILHGFMTYRDDIRIEGVIFNKVGSEKHLEILRESVEPLGVEIVGHVFRDQTLGMPERHLGLVPISEMDSLDSRLDRIAEKLEATVDIGKIMSIASGAEKINAPDASVFTNYSNRFDNIRIGYASDSAFTFYYWDSLDFLEEMGAELVKFSPLEDRYLPENIDGIIFGGGFPELFLDRLSGNATFLEDLRLKASEGMPIYGECGGYMYLGEEIIDFEGKIHHGAGLVPVKTRMTKRLSGLGYREAVIQADSLLGSKGDVLKGHEFHYSTDEREDNGQFALVYNGRKNGYAKNNVFASYLHLNFLSNPEAALKMLQAAETHKGETDK